MNEWMYIDPYSRQGLNLQTDKCHKRWSYALLTLSEREGITQPFKIYDFYGYKS